MAHRRGAADRQGLVVHVTHLALVPSAGKNSYDARHAPMRSEETLGQQPCGIEVEVDRRSQVDQQGPSPCAQTTPHPPATSIDLTTDIISSLLKP